MYYEREKLRTTETPDNALLQILVTISPILCGAIKQSYQNMCRVESFSQDQNTSPLEESEEDLNSSKSLVSIPVDQYPLIITYNTLLLMLDNSLPTPFFSRRAFSNCLKYEVNFERFESHYHIHCHEDMKKFDPNFIFTEIISNIKGSLAALQSHRGCLTEGQYIALSEQRHSILSVNQRKNIYAEFEKYEKLKGQYSEYDLLDVVHYVYHQLLNHSINLPRLYSLFVDEVQDLTPAQIALFKYVCDNPYGYVFAGDTAQTIAPGVGFRFESVKDVFFHEIFPRSTGTRVPEFYHLKQNFRTHSGVVNIANTVVELLVHFFPYSIDKLDPEFSLIEGPLPIFLSSQEDLLSSLFGHSKGSETLQCGFGAEQVILVRDEATKILVKNVIGDKSLVLTVLESKGMEFNDCLVYNFFSSSPVGNDWRALFDLIDPTQSHPHFNNHKHSSMCTELKILYVLLTRSRRNLVIYDDYLHHLIPLFHLWKNRELVNICEYDENIRNIFVRISSPEEWKARGKTFFDRRQFSNARVCYHNSGDLYLEKLCEGCELEQQAEKLSATKIELSRRTYVTAAEIFLQIPDQESRAAKCFEFGREFLKGGDLYCICHKFEAAALCYVAGALYPQTIEAYINCSNYLEALSCCKRLGYFEKSLEILDRFRDTIGLEQYQILKNEWLYKAALNYNAKNNRKKAAEFMGSLKSKSERRKFYERYQYMTELRELSFEEGKFHEIGIVYEQRFEYLEAADCYQRGDLVTDTIRCLLKIVRPKFLNSHLFLEYDAAKINQCQDSMAKLEELCNDQVNTSSQYLEIRFLLQFRNSERVGIDTNFPELQNQSWSPFKLRYHIFQISKMEDSLKNEALKGLRIEISNLVALCQSIAAGNNLQLLSKSELTLALQLFEYFEFVPNHPNPIHASFVLGLRGTFSEIGKHFPQIVDAPHTGANIFKLTLKQFATSAKTYFLHLFFLWSDHCIHNRLPAFDDPSIELQEKYGVAVCLLEILSKQELLDERILSANKQGKRNDLRKRLNSFFLNVLIATPMTSSNAELILMTRRYDQFLFLVSDLVNDLSIDCEKRAALTRALVLSDFNNTQRQVAERLKLANDEIFNHSKYLDLVRAYQWQSEKPKSPSEEEQEASLLPADWVHGEFLYSLKLGVDVLYSELWYGTINKAGWTNPSVKCMSPDSFLDLTEKYFVWLQLCSKSFQNVVLPLNLLRNIVCRKCSGYANVINLYASRKENPTSRQHCSYLLHNLVNSLVKTLCGMSEDVISRWSRAADIRVVGDWTSMLYAFTDRLVVLIYTYVLNLTTEHRTREKNFIDIKTYLRRNLSIYSPALLSKLSRFEVRTENLFRSCIPFFDQMGSPLECFHIKHTTDDPPRQLFNEGIRRRKTIVVESDNFISVIDPLTVDLDEEQMAIPELAHEEGPNIGQTINIETPYETKQEDAAEPPRRPAVDLSLARDILQQVRGYLRRRNSPKGMVWKSCEKVLLENGVDIDSPQTFFYLDALCPMIGTLRVSRTDLDNQIQKLLVWHFISSVSFFLTRLLSQGANSYEEAEEADVLCNQLSGLDQLIERLLSSVDVIQFLKEKNMKQSHVTHLLSLGEAFLNKDAESGKKEGGR
jgi:hypothetical protein